MYQAPDNPRLVRQNSEGKQPKEKRIRYNSEVPSADLFKRRSSAPNHILVNATGMGLLCLIFYQYVEKPPEMMRASSMSPAAWSSGRIKPSGEYRSTYVSTSIIL